MYRHCFTETFATNHADAETSRTVNRVLTYRGDDRDGEIKRAGELPLPAAAVRLRLQDDSLHLPVVLLQEAVLPLQLAQFMLQGLLPGALALRLQRVEHGGSEEQVENDGEDEEESPDVLRLHPAAAAAAAEVDGDQRESPILQGSSAGGGRFNRETVQTVKLAPTAGGEGRRTTTSELHRMFVWPTGIIH